MSLVAYGASDDESDSDSQDESTDAVLDSKTTHSPGETHDPASRKAEQIADFAPKSGLAAKLPPPRVTNSTANETIVSGFGTKRSSLASFLPKPKNTGVSGDISLPKPNQQPLSSLNLDLENEDEIIDVEEEFVPLSSTKKKPQATRQESGKQKSIGSLFSRMPTPWSWQSGISLGKKSDVSENVAMETGGGKQKQPVKIAAPSMVHPDSDDEDDSKPAAKKIKQSEAGSGLAALLPKPKHSVTVRANPNKPAAKLSKRPLIPYTLTKRPAASAKTAPKSQKQATEGDASDEDDEGGPVDFFSFSDKKRTEEKTVSKAATIVSSTIPELPSSSAPVLAPDVSMDANVSSTSSRGNEHHHGSMHAVASYGAAEATGSSTYDVHQYDETSSASHGDATAPYYDYHQQPYATHDQSGTGSAYGYSNASYDQAYHQPQASSSGYSQSASNEAYQAHTSSETDQLDMDKLQRIQGKRNRREQINIIDISAADQTGDVQLMATKLTSEEVAHRPSKKKGGMPTSQQRRKHQITYLAFQAKEKEFELRQQWTANRQTKKQTQSKYGF